MWQQKKRSIMNTFFLNNHLLVFFFFIIIRKTPIFNSLRTLDEFKSGILMRIRDDWCKSSKI